MLFARIIFYNGHCIYCHLKHLDCFDKFQKLLILNIFWQCGHVHEPYGSYVFLYVDLHMNRTVHTFCYVDLHMERTVRIMFGIWIICGPYGPYHIWNVGNVRTPGWAEPPGKQRSTNICSKSHQETFSNESAFNLM